MKEYCVSAAVPSGSGHEKDGSKSRGKLALAGKVVYVDVKDLRQAHAIQTKLKKLGAVSFCLVIMVVILLVTSGLNFNFEINRIRILLCTSSITIF